MLGKREIFNHNKLYECVVHIIFILVPDVLIYFAPKWATYFDLRLEIDEDGNLFTRLYDKRDDFPIVNLSIFK